VGSAECNAMRIAMFWQGDTFVDTPIESVAGECNNRRLINNGDSPWKPVLVACFQFKFAQLAYSATR
jgi:hypothetical protein